MRWLWLGIVAALAGCGAEAPRCVDRTMRDGGSHRDFLECNAGEIAVCDPGLSPPASGVLLYDPDTGALIPVSPLEDGSCGGLDNRHCRPRPYCSASGAAASCPAGTTPHCVNGLETQARIPVDAGTPDGGPPPADAGSDASTQDDAGADDAGADDASTIDAG